MSLLKILRPCSRDDATQIRTVINEAAVAFSAIPASGFEPGAYMSAAELETEMKQVNFYGIWRARRCLAVMGYQPLDDLALVRHAYVLPKYQRQGFGSRLLEHVEELAAKQKNYRLLVGTYTANTWAIEFYRRHDFKPVDEPREMLDKYWNIPNDRAAASTVLEKFLPREDAKFKSRASL